MADFSEQPREAAMRAALRIDKWHAGGDPHVNRHAQQTRQQRRHRADAAGPRVDRRLARAQRYATTQPALCFQPTTSPGSRPRRTSLRLKARSASFGRSSGPYTRSGSATLAQI